MPTRKVTVRIPDSIDIIIDELAGLSGEYRSTVIKMILLESIKRITNEQGEISEEFKDKIKQQMQRSRDKRDSQELQFAERFVD